MTPYPAPTPHVDRAKGFEPGTVTRRGAYDVTTRLIQFLLARLGRLP